MLGLTLLLLSIVQAEENLYQCGECTKISTANDNPNTNKSLEQDVFQKIENNTVFKNCPLKGISLCQICFVKMTFPDTPGGWFYYIYLYLFGRKR